jgi:hypothetical protein
LGRHHFYERIELGKFDDKLERAHASKIVKGIRQIRRIKVRPIL